MSIFSGTWVDWLLLIIIVVSCAYGLMNGFVKEAMSLVVWVASIYVAVSFSETVAHYFESVIQNHTIRYALATLLLMLGCVFIGSLVSFIIRQLLTFSGLAIIDSLFGGVFGFLRGLVFVCILVSVLGATSFTQTFSWQQSIWVPTFLSYSHTILDYLSSDWRKYLDLDQYHLDKWIDSPSNLETHSASQEPSTETSVIRSYLR